MKINLADLKKKAEDASQGPWRLDDEGYIYKYNNELLIGEEVLIGEDDYGFVLSPEDQKFISSANPAVVLELIRCLGLAMTALDRISFPTDSAEIAKEGLTQIQELIE